MAYLDTYTTPLMASAAAHLLRRATFGPTQQEINDFTGKTAAQAVDLLISNASYRATPPPPIEMDPAMSDAGQPFLGQPFRDSRSYSYFNYTKLWWIGLMCEQNGRLSLLEKLASFWQNHFVVNYMSIEDYRFVYQYLQLIRSNALGNFRDFVCAMSVDPAMLVFLNGNENSKEHPNENYARELQELFTVGQKDANGANNYTEQDVKAAAQVLTGWQTQNRRVEGSTTFGASFSTSRHDTSSKTFSVKYNNTVVQGRSDETAGEQELRDLVKMLLAHPECPRFICRKLYRWYVNTNITPEIEQEVITPLASFFCSAANDFAIAPVVKKLLTSNIFFDSKNVGAIIKSPAELMIGSVRFFDQPVPDMSTKYDAFRKFTTFLSNSMNMLQLNLLSQPSVFGSLPYYQTGYSRNWINETTIGVRGSRMDCFVNPSIEIETGSKLGIDILGRLRRLQPNFTDVSGTPAITCEQVLADFLKNLFPIEVSVAQRDFLIDSIMMMKSSPRSTWTREWDAYRLAPNDTSKQNTILWRCRALYKYLLRMAEYQLF